MVVLTTKAHFMLISQHNCRRCKEEFNPVSSGTIYLCALCEVERLKQWERNRRPEVAARKRAYKRKPEVRERRNAREREQRRRERHAQ